MPSWIISDSGQLQIVNLIFNFEKHFEKSECLFYAEEVLFMGFKLVINKQFIKKLDTAAVAALEQTAETLREEIRQARVVPRDTVRKTGVF